MESLLNEMQEAFKPILASIYSLSSTKSTQLG